MNIQFIENGIMHKLTVEEMLELNPVKVTLSERVPGVEGKGMDVYSWYDRWIKVRNMTPMVYPTHLSVEAVDEFCATIAWGELNQAVLLYEQDGMPLSKGYPLRLYVPDGSSACLNVKSVIKLHFIHEADLDSTASYGFKNKISIDELKRN